jgi:para-aminobenzoate synthetase component 2
MILVLDNYDSFTYNLVQYLGELGVDLQVRRNDEITLDEIRALKPERILVSPGPCSPRESGLSNDVIRTFAKEGIPIFGVCLGHQCIGHTFGAEVVVNYRMMHGKTSPIRHNGKDLFEGMPNPFTATRYHSLVIKRDTMPDCSGDHCRERRRRNHGCAAQDAPDLGRAISSRKHPHRERTADHEEFSQVEVVQPGVILKAHASLSAQIKNPPRHGDRRQRQIRGQPYHRRRPDGKMRLAGI